MEPIRFASIGTSHIADVFLDAVSPLPEDIAYVGCYSRSLEKAQEFGSAHGAHLFFDDLDKLGACEEIDAVYIASPNTLHYEQALRLLRAGKHVLLEKPFCPTYKEGLEVFQVAHESGVQIMEGLRSIHDPGFGVVRDTMKSIGTTRSATIRFSKFSGRWELLQSGQTPSCFDPRRAGGSLLDIGIYTVEFAIGLFGAPDTVQATGVLVDVPGIDTALPYHQIDVSGQALLGYKDKVVNLSWGKTSDNHIPSQIEGEKGTILITTESDPRAVSLVIPKPITGAWGMGEGVEHPLDVEDAPNNIACELKDFVAGLRGQDAEIMSIEESERVTLESLRVMDQIREQIGVIFA